MISNRILLFHGNEMQHIPWTMQTHSRMPKMDLSVGITVTIRHVHLRQYKQDCVSYLPAKEKFVKKHIFLAKGGG